MAVLLLIGVSVAISLVIGAVILMNSQKDMFRIIVGLFVLKPVITTPFVFWLFLLLLDTPAVHPALPGALLTAFLIAAGHRTLLAHRAGALLILGGDLLRWLPLFLLREVFYFFSPYILPVLIAIASWTVAYAFLCLYLVRRNSTAGLPSSA